LCLRTAYEKSYYIYEKFMKNIPISLRRPLLSVLVVAGFSLIGYGLLSYTHAATYAASGEAESGQIAGNASLVSTVAGQASGSSAVHFGATGGGTGPTSANPCGGVLPAPAQYHHVIWIWEENKDEGAVVGNAPYFDSIQAKCGTASNVMDSATDPGLVSEPAYAAATSGSNCNTGITSPTTDGSGCIKDDNDNHSLSTQSLFQLAKSSGGSWKSYQESMPQNCATSSSGAYAFKHNPAAFYSQIRTDCGTLDIPIPSLSCSNSSCGTPTGALVNDAKNGTLPTFAFVTPNLDNDMHDGSVQRGDSWLKAYLPLIMDGPNYKAGDTAVFVMWDEGSSNDNGVQDIPTLFVAPAIPAATKVTTPTNNIGILKTTQEMLNLTPLLGCASGTPPGGSGQCGQGSTVSVRAAMHL
jgi:phosphatidylinositol-3-phosphatase